VHQALDERLMRQVAIKLFRADADADVIRRFELEARLLARLCHPGLVEIFDFGHTAEGPYLVLELLPGASLGDLLRTGPRPLAETLRIGAALAQTLAYVHAQGVVHRDVKPANILLDREGRPRLADFGISRAVDTAGSTRTGTVLGTAAYLAPEQVRGRSAGPEADVYALGLVVIECLTAEREYPGSAAESAVARLRRPPRIPAGLPWSLTQALDRMVCADPEERIGAAESAALLSAALEQSGTRVPPPGPPGLPLQDSATGRPDATWVAPRPDAGRPWRRPFAAVALLLAGGGLGWSLVAAGSADIARQPPNHAVTGPSAGSGAAAPTASVGVPRSPTGPAVAGTPARQDLRTSTDPAADTGGTEGGGNEGNGTGNGTGNGQGGGHGHGHGK
jgi:hypothetical protein